MSEHLSTWREKPWPILHVHYDDLVEEDNLISPKSLVTFTPHACAASLTSEKVFKKHVGSLFAMTGLLDEIRKLGEKRNVVVIGMDSAQEARCGFRT
jgi:hypothetical protein